MIAKMRSHDKPRIKLALVAIVIIAVGAALIVLAINTGSSSEYDSPSYFLMDTTLQVKVEGIDQEQAESCVEDAVALARDVEAHATRFESTSDLYKLGDEAGVAPVRVNPDTLQIITESLALTERLGGTFDITIAPVVELWGFYEKNERVPSDRELDSVLGLVDYRMVKVNEAEGTVFLSTPGMSLDLGGAAKGYAVDEMRSFLSSKGVEHALINFGGTVAAVDSRADGNPWVVGIQHPREEGELLGTIEVRDTCVASTGDYERYFVEDGVRYCHIFDPATGSQPREVIATTVVTESGLKADIISTAIFVMGPVRGMEALNDLVGVEGLIVVDDGRVLTSRDFEENYGADLPDSI